MSERGPGDVHVEVVAPGAYASVQDAGRRGWRRAGVPWSGVLDPALMRIANALAGNEAGTPVIECLDGGLHLAARGGTVRLAVAGAAEIEWLGVGARRGVEAWRSVTLADGEQLRVRRLLHGRLAVVAIEGLAVAPMLGSASTYPRAGLGGLDGRALAPGAKLPARPASGPLERMLPQPPAGTASPIRVVAGPQADHFAPEVLEAFVRQPWRVTAEADRMGVRLDGLALAHRGAAEIVSDATVPGAIQVPGKGQPIVLLADAQTAGGYPKIGTVISADLARLAGARPGQVLHFEWVSAAAGEQLAREAEARLRQALATVRALLPGGVDEAALFGANLVSGVVDALAPEVRPLLDLQAAQAAGRELER